MVYHYTDSGLDNIYLQNGYVRHKTAYGEGVSIQNTEALHKEIGRWLVSLPKPLNGAELRFLRPGDGANATTPRRGDQCARANAETLGKA